MGKKRRQLWCPVNAACAEQCSKTQYTSNYLLEVQTPLTDGKSNINDIINAIKSRIKAI